MGMVAVDAVKEGHRSARGVDTQASVLDSRAALGEPAGGEIGTAQIRQAASHGLQFMVAALA